MERLRHRLVRAGLIGGVLLSVIFGCIALVKIRKAGQRGKGLAVAGLVLSAVWVLIIALAVTIGLPGQASGTLPAP